MPRLSSDGDYTLPGKSVWITVKQMSVYIVKTSKGVAVDIFPLGYEYGGTVLASIHANDADVEDAIEEDIHYAELTGQRGPLSRR